MIHHSQTQNDTFTPNKIFVAKTFKFNIKFSCSILSPFILQDLN